MRYSQAEWARMHEGGGHFGGDFGVTRRARGTIPGFIMGTTGTASTAATACPGTPYRPGPSGPPRTDAGDGRKCISI